MECISSHSNALFINAVFPEMYQKWLISQDIDYFFPRDTWLTKMFIGYACLCSIDRWQPRVAAALSCCDVNKHGKRRMSGQYSAGRRVFPRPCFSVPCSAPHRSIPTHERLQLRMRKLWGDVGPIYTRSISTEVAQDVGIFVNIECVWGSGTWERHGQRLW